MKKILFTIVSLAAVLVACNPVEVRDTIGGNITAEEMKAMSKVTVVNIGGKNVNSVICETSAPVNAVWSNTILAQTGNYTELLMFGPGPWPITLKGLCADGTVLECSWDVTVDEMSDKYPVPDEWGYLWGSSEKTWTWNGISAGQWYDGFVWGNCGYQNKAADEQADGASTWWGVPASDVAGQASSYGFDVNDSGDATMTFIMSGAKIKKSSGATGTFALSNLGGKDPSKDFSIGTFKTTGCGILFPCEINTGATVNNFEILRCTEDEFVLTESKNAQYGEATYWRFKAVK